MFKLKFSIGLSLSKVVLEISVWSLDVWLIMEDYSCFLRIVRFVVGKQYINFVIKNIEFRKYGYWLVEFLGKVSLFKDIQIEQLVRVYKREFLLEFILCYIIFVFY